MADLRGITLNVNGETYKVEVKPRWTLLKVLRQKLGLMGTKYGCETGECGSCTVLVDGDPILSCLTLAVDVDGKAITTVEGLAQGGKLHPLQESFIEHHGLQCGYCTPGVLMSAKALLDRNLNPTEEEATEAITGNLCRCGTYSKIIESILIAAEKMRRVK